MIADLNGTWRANAADDGLRRRFNEPDFNDDAWADIEVPGHWRSAAAFASHDGPLLYRKRFEAAARAEGRRSWLVFDGLFYQGDVWLDGGYVGDTEGYFFPHAFEVTGALRERREHVLAVELSCSPPGDRTAKRNITGVFQHWDCLDPDWNPGGIWRPVHLVETGPVRISELRVLCAEASEQRAILDIRARLDAVEATTIPLHTTVGDLVTEATEQQLAAGRNDVRWRLTIDRPPLWWPRALGDQPLCDVTVEIPGCDRVVRRTGLRQVRMKKWIVSINGERIFLKGANHAPTRMALSDATPDELAADVATAIDAGLDLVRVHAHITRPEFYAAADEQGLLLWQDFPLQWGYARGIRKQAARQAEAAVDLLAHHPSIAIWCGHNEPLPIDGMPTAARYLALQELPTWNKTVLDATVKRAFERADGTRPVIAHSGVLPHPGSGGTDTHIYFGWYHGEERDFPGFCAAVPRMARFVTEFGAQAVPRNAEFMAPEQWPDLDWDRLARTHSLQLEHFERYVPPKDFATFDEWRAATQTYQATVIKHHIETLRRLKYVPTGGFCQFMLADAHPAVTWSVLDHTRAPKQGFDALRAACAPVIVVADRPSATYIPGEELALNAHVVSDQRKPIEGGLVTARVSWRGGAREWRFGGDVGADTCVCVGTIAMVVPDAPGPIAVDLTFEGDGVTATNHYDGEITPP